MNADRERVSLADLLGIQVLRRLDQNEPHYCADIDVPLAEDETLRDHRGHLKDPSRVLSDRADKVLQTRYGVNAGWLGEVLGWLRIFRFLGYLLVLFMAFSLAKPWLSQDELINVEWIFGFLATLFLSMLITSLLMIMAVFSKRKGEDSPDQTSGGGATKTFAKLLVVHWMIQFVIRRAVPWIERRILKRTGEKTPEELARIEKVSEALYDTLSKQSRRTALEAAATSNTVWCLLSIGVFVSLMNMGVFHQYDFRWQATIVSEDFMLDSTQALARPLEGLSFLRAPNAADVRWLATGELITTKAIDLKDPGTAEAEHQEHRQLWGRLFLAYLMAYGVLPRFVLMVVSRWLAARGWKSLHPRLKDPYFKTLVDNIETPPFDTSQEEGIEEPEPEPVAAPVETSPPPSVAESEIPAGKSAVVFSYDVPEPSEGWPKALCLAGKGEVLSLGNACDRASRKQVLTELTTRREEIGLFVLVADLVDNPDGLFEHFVKESLGHLSASAGRSMVLTGGERLRKRFEGDDQKIAARVDLWKQRGESSGMQHEKIVEFDLDHATTAGRDLLKQRMQSFLPNAAPMDELSPLAIQAAGVFRKATSVVIMSRINEDTAKQSPDELRTTAVKIHEELRGLYQKQASALEKAFANVKIDTNRIRSAVSSTASSAHSQFDKLEEFSRMTAVVSRYTKGLSAKWAVGGGLICAMGSGALAILAAPALLPAIIPAAAVSAQAGVLGGVLSRHAPHLAAKLTRRKPQPDPEDDTEDPAPEDEFSLDDLVRSSTLLALILELQGNAEDQIARALETILAEISEEELNTPESASTWLVNVADRTENYLAENQSSQ